MAALDSSVTAAALDVRKPSTVDDVIVTSLLSTRHARSPDYRAENEALTALIGIMSETPDIMLQKLAETALKLCDADSAGISIAEVEAGEEIFRWRATAGHYTEYLGGTMPRHFSPCGVVIDRNAPILMSNMVAYYDYVSALKAPPQEALLLPFLHNGKPVGTVWVVAHDDRRQFDAEDLRILHSLTNVASMAVQAFARTHELEKANAAARASVETREQFIAVLGHDLRNPVGAILNGAKLLEHGVPAERAAHLAQLIGKSAYRITEMVDNLLDFARGRLGGGIALDTQLHPSLAPILGQVVSELSHTHPQRHLDTDYRFTYPVTVDADRIGQMMSNLIGNALTHGAPDAPVVISGHTDNGVLTLSVSNRGAPIPADVMDRLFKPFERGSDGNQNGLGLGLYIAYEIARAHGGTLTATSNLSETRFTFTMPL